jgi:alkaline phosphatase
MVSLKYLKKGAHTGVDVNVYATGPGSELIRYNMENIDVYNAIFDFLDFNLVGNKTAPTKPSTFKN